MRRVVGVMVLVLLTVWGVANAQQEPCCQNTITGQVVPRMMGSCDALGPAWVGHPGPCIPEEQPPTWWDALLAWADGRVVYNPDPGTLAKLLAWLTAFVTFIQVLKKGLEGQGLLGFLLKLLPSKVTAWFAHAWGPILMNVIITGGVMLVAALQSPGLTLGEVIRIVAAVGGADLLYRLLRNFVFTKAPQ